MKKELRFYPNLLIKSGLWVLRIENRLQQKIFYDFSNLNLAELENSTLSSRFIERKYVEHYIKKKEMI